MAVVQTIGFNPEIAARFSQRRELEDEWARRALQKPGIAHRGSALISPRTLKATALYADVIKPLDAEHMLGGFVEAGGGGVAGFSVLRSKTRGDYTDNEVDAMNYLFPHIRRAFHMHTLFAAALEKAASFDHSLELMAEPVFIIDTHGNVRVARQSG